MNVTTNAEASNPALGKVVKVTTADLNDVTSNLANSLSLAAGYITLYQGQSATGASPGVDPTVTGVNNGNLATIEGAGSQPGSPTASTAFLPPGTGPAFPSPHQGLVPGLLYGFRARVTGGDQVPLPRRSIAHHLGRSNSIRADQGQPITIGSISQTGNGVTINSPLGGQLTIGQNFVAGYRGDDPGRRHRQGRDRRQCLHRGRGRRRPLVPGQWHNGWEPCLRAQSTFPAGSNIPAGSIYINNKLVGTVQW